MKSKHGFGEKPLSLEPGLWLCSEPAMPTILLVEDNEMNRDMLSRRLSRKGFEVQVAVNGQEGLKKVRSFVPDLVLMDLNLPEIDGWEATRRLKADPETRHIPVLALTAHALPSERQAALDCGCDDYDSKPVDFERLLSKIQKLLP